MFHFNNHLLHKALWVRLVLHQLQLLVDQPCTNILLGFFLSTTICLLEAQASLTSHFLGGGQVSGALVDLVLQYELGDDLLAHRVDLLSVHADQEVGLPVLPSDLLHGERPASPA